MSSVGIFVGGIALALIASVTVNVQTSQAENPVGRLDIVSNTNCQVKGWAYDPDAPSKSIPVMVWVSRIGKKGNYFVGETVAKLPRPDVNRALGISGRHGFSFTIPPHFRDAWRVYVDGIDITGGYNVHLSNTPRQIRCS